MNGKHYATLRKWLAAGSNRGSPRYVLTRGQVYAIGDKTYSVSTNAYVIHAVEAALPALPNGAIPFSHSYEEAFSAEYPDVMGVFREVCDTPKMASITFSHYKMVGVLQAILIASYPYRRGEIPIVLEMLPETGINGEGTLHISRDIADGVSHQYKIAASPSSSFRVRLNANYLYAALKDMLMPEKAGDALIRFEVPAVIDGGKRLPFVVRSDYYSPAPQTAMIMPMSFPEGEAGRDDE